MDASFLLEERTESDPGAASASGNDQENGEDPPAILSGRRALVFSSWGWLPPTVVRGWTRGQSRRLEREPAVHKNEACSPEVLLAAAHKWCTKPEESSWATENAVVLMAGGSAVKNTGELNVCVSSVLPEDVPPPL